MGGSAKGLARQAPEHLVAAHDQFPERGLTGRPERPVHTAHVEARLALQAIVDEHVGIEIGDQRRERLAVGQTAADPRQHPAVIEEVRRHVDMMPDLVSQHLAREVLDARLDDPLQPDDDRLVMQPDHGERVREPLLPLVGRGEAPARRAELGEPAPQAQGLGPGRQPPVAQRGQRGGVGGHARPPATRKTRCECGRVTASVERVEAELRAPASSGNVCRPRGACTSPSLRST